MKPSRIAATALAVAVLGFAAVTLTALESASVAVLLTTSETGAVRRTRVWFAEENGAYWIESATAERPFYRDLERTPALEMEIRDGPPFVRVNTIRGQASLVPEPGGHQKIRSLLARKYGWADRWVAMLQDTSGSRAVRIVPEPAATLHSAG